MGFGIMGLISNIIFGIMGLFFHFGVMGFGILGFGTMAFGVMGFGVMGFGIMRSHLVVGIKMVKKYPYPYKLCSRVCKKWIVVINSDTF